MGRARGVVLVCIGKMGWVSDLSCRLRRMARVGTARSACPSAVWRGPTA